MLKTVTTNVYYCDHCYKPITGAWAAEHSYKVADNTLLRIMAVELENGTRRDLCNSCYRDALKTLVERIKG